MKTTLEHSKQNKNRSHALKSILISQDNVALNTNNISTNDQARNIVNLKEDLIDVEEIPGNQYAPKSNPVTPLTKSIELLHGLIQKELVNAAAQLKIDCEELSAWVDLQAEVPTKTILNLLRAMQTLHLDPLCEEIGFTQYEDGGWQVFISIDGYMKLLNQHNQFNGITFKQADTLIEGIPEWMECSIYRKDRLLPTTVREYFIEVRAETEIWKKMPRRLLRHRALQQCARLAIFSNKPEICK